MNSLKRESYTLNQKSTALFDNLTHTHTTNFYRIVGQSGERATFYTTNLQNGKSELSKKQNTQKLVIKENIANICNGENIKIRMDYFEKEIVRPFLRLNYLCE